jgi:hypothetical protein
MHKKGDVSERAGFLGLGCMLFCSIQISTDVAACYFLTQLKASMASGSITGSDCPNNPKAASQNNIEQIIDAKKSLLAEKILRTGCLYFSDIGASNYQINC